VPVGQVNYEVRGSAPRTAELDIWLRSEGDCGRGYGPDALTSLTRSLAEAYGVREFILRPSARNTRAVKAYEKAGFRRLPLSPEQLTETYGPGDCADAVVMRLRLPE
jgi:RimJ/RimL family protein N-acetyltransferase